MIANKESRDLVFCFSAFLPSLLGWIRLRPGVGVPTRRLSGMPANPQKAPTPTSSICCQPTVVLTFQCKRLLMPFALARVTLVRRLPQPDAHNG